MTISAKKTFIWGAAWAVICLMVLAAELTGEREIIFPEITAMLIGAWLAPRQPWFVPPGKIFLSVVILSVAGVLIVRFLPIPVFCQAAAGYICAACCLLALRITMFPLISAIILPILLGTESWIYPLAASALAAVVALGRAYLLKEGLTPPVAERWDYELREQLPLWGKRLLAVVIFAVLALGLRVPFAIAPPLLVGFTELTNPGSPARKIPGKVWLMVVIAAVCGSGARLLLVTWLGLPLTLAAALAGAVFLFIVRKSGVYFPPAGAIAILPMLLDKAIVPWLPLEVAVGFGVMVATALVLFKEKRE
ncbi:MAG: hypothetical protein IIZ45_00970 [Firmicutes bacterium]|nr:hypothetical protein [Bacillota bacterium]